MENGTEVEELLLAVRTCEMMFSAFNETSKSRKDPYWLANDDSVQKFHFPSVLLGKWNSRLFSLITRLSLNVYSIEIFLTSRALWVEG